MAGRPFFPLIASTVTIVFGVLTLVTHDPMWVQIKVTIFNALFAGFLFVGLWTGKNFFKIRLRQDLPLHPEGLGHVHSCFACSSSSPPCSNEYVRLTFKDDHIYNVLGHMMSGVDIWIAFKLFIVLPLSGIYAWMLTKIMSKHHIEKQGNPPSEACPNRSGSRQ